MDSIKSAINKETFINNEGKKVRNSNIEKIFNIKCSKDELNKTFEENKMKRPQTPFC